MRKNKCETLFFYLVMLFKRAESFVRKVPLIQRIFFYSEIVLDISIHILTKHLWMIFVTHIDILLG